MRGGLIATSMFFAAMLGGAAQATPIPSEGVTMAEIRGWLQGLGYAPQEENSTDTSVPGVAATHLTFDYQGVKLGVYLFDCKAGRCGSVQFASGWATHGKFDTSQMNHWNRSNRWCRGYFDSENDPWLEMDVDLTPGGSYELLNDNLATYRNACLGEFRKMYNF
ncbi:MAG TPA: YbjN domain-containing protein [Caulobacteraceae bacterium]